MLLLWAAGAIGSQPVVGYTLTVTPGDVAGFNVEMRIRNAPDTFRLAMMTHPEYDDRFWRYVRDVHVESGGSEVRVVREDSALWRTVISGGGGGTLSG